MTYLSLFLLLTAQASPANREAHFAWMAPAAFAGKWQAGLIEQHTYKLGEAGIPGTSTYTLRGILLQGKKVLEVEVETHRTLSFGAQQGKLVSHSITWMDPATFDMLESRLTATMNGAEASYLHAIRQGASISVYQKLRGSPDDTRHMDAQGIVIDDNAQNFYVERLPWAAGREFEWNRYNAAQSRLISNKASVEQIDKDTLQLKIVTDIAPTSMELTGKPRIVSRVVIAGTDQLKLQDSQ
jgi:hypothetical protein